MVKNIRTFITKNRRFIPVTATAVLVLAAYIIGAVFYPGMRNPQVFFNLFRNNTYLLISAVGMTFVILTAGIDLSVSGVIALTTVAAAALLREGWDAWLVILVMLVMGTALGSIMGSFIAYLKVQPFIATLAGLWFARGMCFFISDDAIPIDNRIYKILGQTKLLIPGWTELAEKGGNPAPFVSILVVLSLVIFVAAIFIAQYTRFGRTIYAIGGNEQSARLMGLPVERTIVLVYAFSGFCSALAGICLSVFVASGHGFYANGFELDVIAAVVIGGTMLSGGSGYVFGTLFGVLVLAVTQVLVQFIGALSSWWTKIVIGILMLIFIGVQSILASQEGGRARTKDPQALAAARIRRRKQILMGGGLVVVFALALIFIPRMGNGNGVETAVVTTCEIAPFREEEAAELIQDGAVIVYNRTAGTGCVDELYAVYPDGRIVANNGKGNEPIETQVDPAEVERILIAASDEYRWFTDYMYSTYHNPCRQCYAHYLTISYNGQIKGITAVDGGVDMQPEYGYTLSIIRPILPKFSMISQ
ncbi:MAG: sugar ABC transporter permease YjfF [Anaerolineales bacterium]|jgi:simple sugar transport system permease protein